MIINRPDWTKQIERKKSKIWLDKNENSDEFLGKINLRNLKKIKNNDIFAYPDLGKLYKMLSKSLKINYKKILLTNGADGAIKLVFDVLSRNKKFTVIRFEPSFAMYEIYSKLYSKKDIVIDYKKKEDNKPYFDISELLNKVKIFKPNLILIANPNSPTGTILSKKKLLNIINEAKKVDCHVLLDEAYFPYSNMTLINQVEKYHNLIVIRSLKAFGLSGLRVGYLISNVNFIKWVGSYRPLYEINSLGAFLFSKLLKDYSVVKRLVKKQLFAKKFFIQELKKRKIKYINSYGNFIHLKIIKKKEQILKTLSKKFYIRFDENHYTLKGFSRISFTSMHNYKLILKIIDKYYNEKR